MSTFENDNPSRSKKESPYDQLVDRRIQASDNAMRETLKRIEDDYRAFLNASLSTCNSFAKIAQEEGNSIIESRYALLAEVYEQLLKNFTLSKSYNKN